MSAYGPMKVVAMLISQLKPAEYNPRKSSPEEVARLKESILRFGFVEPVVCNGAPKRRNVIIGGHFRVRVAQSMGMTTVPVVYVNVPDIEREKELNLRLNKNTGSWDYALLAQFSEDVLKDVGFNEDELKVMTADLPSEDPGNEKPEVEFTPELGRSSNYVVLKFDTDVDWLHAQTILGIKPMKALDCKKGFVRQGVGRVFDGIEAFRRIKESAK